MSEVSVYRCIDLVEYMSAFDAHYESDFYFKGEFHDFWEIVYVISGEIGVSADEKIYNLSESDIIFHKPMEFHKLWSVNNSAPYLFIMSFNLSGEQKLIDKLCGSVLKLNPSQHDLMSMLMSAFAQNSSRLQLGNTTDFINELGMHPLVLQEVKNYSELLFISIIQSQGNFKKPYDARSAKIYSEIIRVMEQCINSWVSVEEISQKCNYSQAYTKKIFKQYSDCGIHNYFIKMKIKKAISLMESGMSVQQTSDELSFGNVNYFGIVFKRETGFSPLKYIKNLTQN